MANQDKQTGATSVITSGDVIYQYKIIRKLGEGGMGEVYLADDTRLDRKVALKFLSLHLIADAGLKARFTREAQAAARINHPNVVHIYEVSEYNGRPFFAMEYIEGKSLHHFAHEEPLPLDKILKLTIQICEGLTKAHQMGIVHRDIKASNIIVDDDWRPKILDFGLATMQGTEHLTQAGSTIGTVAYMSPEQAMGLDVDQRSDIFSLGIVLYELIAGRTPFKRDNTAATLQAIVHDEPEPLARYKVNTPDGLQVIISKALEKNLEMRYPMAVGLLADLKREKRALESDVTVSLPPTHSVRLAPKRRRLSRYLVPGTALVIVAVLLLVLRPWNLEFSSTDAAVAGDNRLVVMYFNNLADPEDEQRLGEIAANLLIADLSESQYIQVVSSQGLYDILKRLGRENTKQIVRGVDSEIARQANARWMLLGSILQVEPELIITTQLVEVASNNVLSSARISGQPGDDIFALVDKLTITIKTELALPGAALAERDPQVVNITTPSAEAYRHFLEGMEYHRKFFNNEARQSFEKSLGFDSTFAMAHYGLSLVLHEQTERRDAINRAVRYIENANSIERQYILAQQARLQDNTELAIDRLEEILAAHPDEKLAYYYIGNICFEQRDDERAIEKLLKAVEIDPLLKEAYNQLAYAYNRVGDVEKSIWAINKYIELAPDEPNPYDSRGELYGFNGKVEQATASYEKALEKNPTYYPSLRNLAALALHRQDWAEAERLVKRLASDADAYTRSYGRLHMARIPAYQGRFKQALRLLEIGIESDRLEMGEGIPMVDKYLYRAYVLYQIKEYDRAISELDSADAIVRRVAPESRLTLRLDANKALCFAAKGNDNAARRLIEPVRAYVDSASSQKQISAEFWRIAGQIDFLLKRYTSAVAHFQKANSVETGFFNSLMIGRCYLELGRIGDAVNTLERTLQRHDYQRGEFGPDAVKAHYWLGIAYEESGWEDKALAQYEMFRSIWKAADTNLAELKDARLRIAQLKSQT